MNPYTGKAGTHSPYGSNDYNSGSGAQLVPGQVDCSSSPCC